MTIQIPHQTIAQMLRRSLTKQQYALATVSSGSMSPLLEVGDQVGLTAVPLTKLRVGDIITVETEYSLLTHRLCTITPTHVITRGDRVIAYDPPMRHERIIGRVVMVRRGDDIVDHQHPSTAER